MRMFSRFFRKSIPCNDSDFSRFIVRDEQIICPVKPTVLIRGCQFNSNHYRNEFFGKIMGVCSARLRTRRMERQAEFIAGRYLASRMLLEKGIDNKHVGRGCHGEPLWPLGFTGSISHTSNQVVCALACKSDIRYLGLDIEPTLTSPMAGEIEGLVINPDEKALAIDNGILPAQLVSMAFSAKESLFKAVSHEAGTGFGFDSARVVGFHGTGLTLELSTGISSSLPKGRRFDCFVGQHRECILALIAE